MRQTAKKRLGRLAVLILSLGLVFLLFLLLSEHAEKKNEREDDGKGATDYLLEREIVYIDGEAYLPKKGVSSYLLIGVDADGKVQKSESYNNCDKADFLALLVLDSETRSYTLLHINRDTMAMIPVLGIGGKKAGERYAQLATAHTYGDGTELSCRNTVNAVSEFLYGTKIDGYASFNMEAVKILTDKLGGVKMTLPKDYTDIDEAFFAGADVILDGDAALRFVRSRKNVEDQTNISRMERQKLFLSAFVDTLLGKADSETYLLGLYSAVSEYSVTDMTAGELAALFSEASSYERAAVLSPAGEAKLGDEFMEFHVDEEDLRRIVKELTYSKYEG